MSEPHSMCALTDCSYTAGDDISCSPGGNDCTAAYFQTAYKSAFHDDPLRELTDHINERLYKMSRKPPRPGLQLSILWTGRGPFLAWTEHKNTPPSQGVMRDHGLAANDDALGLYPHPYHPGFDVEPSSAD